MSHAGPNLQRFKYSFLASAGQLQRLCNYRVKSHQMKPAGEKIIGVACITIYAVVTALVAIAAWRDHQADREAFSKAGIFNISVEPEPSQHKRKHRN
jgi:hypothetical protein